MKRFLAVSVLIFINSVYLSARPYHLLEAESPYALQQSMIEFRLLAGYETGYVPDALIHPALYFGIFNWLQVGGGFSYVQFDPFTGEKRISEYDAGFKLRLLNFNTLDLKLFMYGKYREAPGDLVIEEYTGSLLNVAAVINPRADCGRDITGGLSGRMAFNIGKNVFGILYDCNYSYTMERYYFPEEWNRRLFCSTAPVFYPNSKIFKKNSLMFGVQNRYTDWFDRGRMYHIMPQISWEFIRGGIWSAGVSVPVKSGKDYHYMTEVLIPVDLGGLFGTLSADLDFSPGTFSPDGDGNDDILYLEPGYRSRKPIKSWSITIYEPSGSQFRKFSGSGEPPSELKWNGKSDSGELVESTKEYPAKLVVTDTAGARAVDQAVIPVDILVERIPGGYRIVLSNIEFEYDKYAIKKKYYPVLDQIADYLDDQYKHCSVEIQGHTDNSGSPGYNMTLSDKRAQSVMLYLIREGINDKRLKYRGFGESKPVSTNSTEEGRQRNRRVEFILRKK